MAPSMASSQSPAITEVPAPPPKSSDTPIAIGVVIGLVAFLGLVGLGFWLLRRRHLHPSSPGFHRRSAVDSSHLACHVTPFGSPGGEQPRFVHKPGEHMRVAHRRSDGGWEFTDVEQDPTTPSSDLSHPRFSRFTHSSFSFISKDNLKPGELTTRGFMELNGEDNPPPAYHPGRSSLSEYQASLH